VTIQLNHTIVWCKNKEKSAAFLTTLFGLPPARDFGPFKVVELANGVSLDFYTVDHKIALQHYAFLISEDEFDAIFGRIRAQGLDYWADPHKQMPGRINHNDGGRGAYFHDLDGHFLEIITRPYDSGN
jgi:catechol 2,3-dioxygenase-like lactoylglutathione lyase family enzyme